VRPQLLVSRSLTPLALLAVVLLLPDDVRARQPRPLSDDAILVNVTKYVSEYEAAFTAIVAEERYEQTYQPPPRPGSGPGAGTSGFQRRTLVSDYLLVRPPGVDAWLPFRDVAEVNGRPVRDRSDRLTKLFLESSPRGPTRPPASPRRARATTSARCCATSTSRCSRCCSPPRDIACGLRSK
jgi:hypothetical protein